MPHARSFDPDIAGPLAYITYSPATGSIMVHLPWGLHPKQPVGAVDGT